MCNKGEFLSLAVIITFYIPHGELELATLLQRTRNMNQRKLLVTENLPQRGLPLLLPSKER